MVTTVMRRGGVQSILFVKIYCRLGPRCFRGPRGGEDRHSGTRGKMLLLRMVVFEKRAGKRRFRRKTKVAKSRLGRGELWGKQRKALAQPDQILNSQSRFLNTKQKTLTKRPERESQEVVEGGKSFREV